MFFPFCRNRMDRRGLDEQVARDRHAGRKKANKDMMRMDENKAEQVGKRLQASAQKTSLPLKAVSHRDRLLILHLLGSTELCVSDIAEATRLPQPVVSQHLGRLRRVNLVKRRRDSTSAFYSVDRARVDELFHSLAALFGLDADMEEPAAAQAEEAPKSVKQPRRTVTARTPRLPRIRRQHAA
jgi:ArsR family transcriptional regulator, virulence genes transcriptional regulator